MSSNELIHFRDRLLSERNEILKRLRGVDDSVRNLSEPEIELEEAIQKKVISDFYGKLGNEAKLRIGLIDLALRKIPAGEYGICESCEDDISPKRLEAVPWARLCIGCAREHERRKETLPEPAIVIPSAKLQDEYARLPRHELIRLIEDRIAAHIDPDGIDIRISVLNGVVHLEGAIQSEEDRETVLQVLTDEMKIDAVLDLMQVAEAAEMEEVADFHSDTDSEPLEGYAE